MQTTKVALIVSCDYLIIQRFLNLLKNAGFTCLIESYRIAALFRILEMDVEVVLVDVEDGNIDVKDFLRIIKKLRPRLRIIAITDDASIEMRDRLLEEGVMFRIVKSIPEEQIASLIDGLCHAIFE